MGQGLYYSKLGSEDMTDMTEGKEVFVLHPFPRKSVAQRMGWGVNTFSLKQLFKGLFGSFTGSPVVVLHNLLEI